MNLSAFLEQHEACEAGANWALATGCETVEQIWQRDDLKAEWRIWIATRPGVLPDSTLRKFTCSCVREVWHLLVDERSRKAVEVAEKYADGLATDQDLAAAKAAAWDAARAAARAAAWSAALAAADGAANAPARAAARAAVWTAARAAAMAAADVAARAAAWDAARAAARDAVWTAARAAAKAAAKAAARAAADAASWDAAWAAADAAARTRQAEILREMGPTLGGLAE
jgi:hypothetical protein